MKIFKIKSFYIYLWASILLMFVISGAYGMFEYTKRYSFCRGCHEMNQAHDTWMASKHGPILSEIDSCMACHAEEGAWGYIKAKVGGLASVYYHISGQITDYYQEVAKGKNPVYCTKSECHDVNDLGVDLKIRVDHKFHEEKGFACASCHDRIAHGWDEGLRDSPNMQHSCFNCHDGKTAPQDDCGMCHIYQDKMLKGIGMDDIFSCHGDDLLCTDCHIKACTPDVETCSSCHDEDIFDQAEQLQTKISVALEELKATFSQLDRIFAHYSSNKSMNNKTFYKKNHRFYVEAMKNYQFIKKDSSRGVHNPDYVWKLVQISKEKAELIILSLKNAPGRD